MQSKNSRGENIRRQTGPSTERRRKTEKERGRGEEGEGGKEGGEGERKNNGGKTPQNFRVTWRTWGKGSPGAGGSEKSRKAALTLNGVHILVTLSGGWGRGQHVPWYAKRHHR